MKPLNSGHLRVFKNLSAIERCPLFGGNLTKIVTFGTKCFVCHPVHVRHWEVSLYIYSNCPWLSTINLTVLELENAFECLKANKTPGYDDVSADFVKKCPIKYLLFWNIFLISLEQRESSPIKWHG